MKYYKYEGYKGNRFFKINDLANFPESETVIQVCVSPGAIKKGRGHCMGIYMIRRTTMLSNFVFLSEFMECTKDEYETAKEQVLKLLL